ncbi:hypothetical protein DXG03_001785 [Asterophora parasitica]|uniref:Uncharacterized protein n=1 Tax=Asterophora parasitica TaxID=117018 RepID=A0A9P7KCM7_9AGAR|nr:hypothetical protein DXG03_001785 [Asterophora parasitica]
MPRSVKASSRGAQTIRTPLRAVSPEEAELWSDGDSDSTLAELQPTDIDESWEYTFHPHDTVWVRTVGGNWHIGRVSGLTTRKGKTRQKEGLFYPVLFNKDKIRKYFAPLNGDIKPNNHHIRNLLKEAGVLADSGSESEGGSS